MSKHTFLVSDETVNSYGFRVLTAGIDTTRFEQNPIMLYMHERPRIIGKWDNLRKEKGQLFADAIFDIQDPFANEIAGKVERGFLKCASIGIGNAQNENGIVSTCQLFEISIVDIGSNTNAIRLYQDASETIQLKLNDLTAVNSLTSILGLSQEHTHTQIVEQVKLLVQQSNDQKTELEAVKLYQKGEAIYLIDEAVKRGLIKENYRGLHLKEFELNFEKARFELADLFPFKRLSLIDMIHEATENKKASSKENWTLEDYRIHAPKDLEADPELFKTLLAKTTFKQ
ncbi:phage prohead protease [Flavobacterium psychrophilum]|nr:phage prohead protease [Flavobacterium psychrophilum]